MGDDSGYATPHKVTLTRGFWLGETQVTQEFWQAVMGKNPSYFKGAKLPVDRISWNSCQEFIAKLNGLNAAPADFTFSLPSEAQWEYACRAGSKTAYCFGDDEKQLNDYGWYYGNSGIKTHPVGQKKANGWGLHDMHGNVWEWCLDWYGTYPNDDVTDPSGVSSGIFRVLRGGCWYRNAGYCRSASRYNYTPESSINFLGLRIALVPQ
jgi:formylglycine-generating enzyme required for sulfatase activity